MAIPIPIGTAHTAELSGSFDARFTCAHCGVTRRAEIYASAKGAASSVLFIDRRGATNRAHRAAEEALNTELERLLALTRCPACGRDQPGAARVSRAYLWRAIPTGIAAAIVTVVFGGMAVLGSTDLDVIVRWLTVATVGNGALAFLAHWKLRTMLAIRRAREGILLLPDEDGGVAS